jgi:hypothetical protein
MESSQHSRGLQALSTLLVLSGPVTPVIPHSAKNGITGITYDVVPKMAADRQGRHWLLSRGSLSSFYALRKHFVIPRSLQFRILSITRPGARDGSSIPEMVTEDHRVLEDYCGSTMEVTPIVANLVSNARYTKVTPRKIIISCLTS